jgi:anti-sigma factor RsiW
MSEPTEDEIIATLSDYLDGALPADKQAEVAKKIESDADWKRMHGELRETRDALSGLQKARAPATFTEEVTGTIHKRSAGRFFGRRTLGDRVPFGALFVIAIVVLLAIGYVMWSSPTGSLKVEPKRNEPSGSAESIKPAP